MSMFNRQSTTASTALQMFACIKSALEPISELIVQESLAMRFLSTVDPGALPAFSCRIIDAPTKTFDHVAGVCHWSSTILRDD